VTRALPLFILLLSCTSKPTGTRDADGVCFITFDTTPDPDDPDCDCRDRTSVLTGGNYTRARCRVDQEMTVTLLEVSEGARSDVLVNGEAYRPAVVVECRCVR